MNIHKKVAIGVDSSHVCNCLQLPNFVCSLPGPLGQRTSADRHSANLSTMDASVCKLSRCLTAAKTWPVYGAAAACALWVQLPLCSRRRCPQHCLTLLTACTLRLHSLALYLPAIWLHAEQCIQVSLFAPDPHTGKLVLRPDSAVPGTVFDADRSVQVTEEWRQHNKSKPRHAQCPYQFQNEATYIGTDQYTEAKWPWGLGS